MEAASLVLINAIIISSFSLNENSLPRLLLSLSNKGRLMSLILCPLSKQLLRNYPRDIPFYDIREGRLAKPSLLRLGLY